MRKAIGSDFFTLFAGGQCHKPQSPPGYVREAVLGAPCVHAHWNHCPFPHSCGLRSQLAMLPL